MKKSLLLSLLFILLASAALMASEADLKIPSLSHDQNSLLIWGFVVCFLGMVFGLFQYLGVRKLRAHSSMLDVSKIIFETCKTYLIQQGKFLVVLFIFIALCIAFYFGFLQGKTFGGILLILMWTVIGILGSYGVAWFGIRMNTFI